MESKDYNQIRIDGEILSKKIEDNWEKLHGYKDELEDLIKSIRENGQDFETKKGDGYFVVKEPCNLPSETINKLNLLYKNIGCMYKEQERLNNELNLYRRLKRIDFVGTHKNNTCSLEELKKLFPEFYSYPKEEREKVAEIFSKYHYVMHTMHFSHNDIKHAAIVGNYTDLKDPSKDLFGVVDTVTGEEILPLLFSNPDDAIRVFEKLNQPRSAQAWKMKPNTALEEEFDKVLYSSVAVVTKNGKYGICEEFTTDVIIPCEYDLKTLAKMWKKLDYRETSLDKNSPFTDVYQHLAANYPTVIRCGQVYFATDFRSTGDGAKDRYRYEVASCAVYSARTGELIIPFGIYTYNGAKKKYEELGCPTEASVETLTDNTRK